MDHEEEGGVSAGLTIGCPAAMAIALVMLLLVVVVGAVVMSVLV